MKIKSSTLAVSISGGSSGLISHEQIQINAARASRNNNVNLGTLFSFQGGAAVFAEQNFLGGERGELGHVDPDVDDLVPAQPRGRVRHGHSRPFLVNVTAKV